jgi:hypothetical protein
MTQIGMISGNSRPRGRLNSLTQGLINRIAAAYIRKLATISAA